MILILALHGIGLAQKNKDTTGLGYALIHGRMEGVVRSVCMSTINKGVLKDDYAVGLSTRLLYETKSFHGLQIGMGGYTIINAISSNLAEPDKTTKSMNRYELGLFDIEHPTNKYNMNKLEKLYLRYTRFKSTLDIGRIAMNNPFVNSQDGRLGPTAQQGAWLSMKNIKKLTINIGWVNAISPRSTIKWYSVENSIGIYACGVDVNGAKSKYKNNIHSKGLGILNLQYKPGERTTLNVWDGMIENVLNTLMVELNHEGKKINGKYVFYNGIMMIRQDAIHDGGNPDPSLTYVQAGGRSNIVSVQLGWRGEQWNTNFNFTRITAAGRYLMPREWGRDPFYTFMSRERNEGLGDVYAFMLRSTHTGKRIKQSLAIGYYDLPGKESFGLNKYTFPSYLQLNYDAIYTFMNKWKNLSIRTLIAYKKNAIGSDAMINKVEMINLNFISEYKFNWSMK